jgi:hypothetical protein
LAREKTFLAKLLDDTGNILDESFFGSHGMASARESAKNWAKKYENAGSIKLTDADDVTITEDVDLEASENGRPHNL